MAGMKERVFSDFSGGVLEEVSPYDFSARNASQLHGVVFDNEQVLRSQWAIQKVGGPVGATLKAIHVLGDDGSDFAIGLDEWGDLWWAVLPHRNASDVTTAEFVGWKRITSGEDALTGQSVPVSNDPTRRFLCEVPVPFDDARTRTGVLVNSLFSNHPPLVLYKKISNGIEFIAVRSYTAYYPTSWEGDAAGVPQAGGGYMYPTEGVMPRANAAAMWGDVLMLADVQVPKNLEQPMGVNNVKRESSAMWSSYPNSKGVMTVEAFEPGRSLHRGFASPEAQIVALFPVQAGLLVITNSVHGEGRDGLILLRGTAYDYEVEVIRSGIGPKGLSGESEMGHRPVVGYWPEVGALCFVAQTGQVWHTDGQRAEQLDRAAFDAPRTAQLSDHVRAMRGYLLVSRGNRLLCLNLVTSSLEEGYACWTELVTPHPSLPVLSMTQVEDSMYFIQGGELFRFQMGETRPRGTINGAPITVTVAAAPQLSDGPTGRGRWARVGVRAHSPSNSGTLVSVSSVAGSPLLPGTPTLTTPLARDLSGHGHTVVVRGHGLSNTATVAATFTGDVVVEAMTLVESGTFRQGTSGVSSTRGGQ